MNIEYDHIRDILMEHPELWERFKGMYWYKKYNNYIGTIRRIGMEYRHEFVERFSAEFKRGLEKKELDPSVFSVAAWKKIQIVAAEPDTFYKVWVVAGVTERKLNKKIMHLFANADWHEREMMELYGIRVANQPNPRRLFLDEELDAGILNEAVPLSIMMNGACTTDLWERILKEKEGERA